MSTARFLAAPVFLLLAAGAAACQTTRAAVPVDRPTLEVPPPPPRLIEPPPTLESPPPEPLTELPAATPTGGASRPRPPRDAGAAKPEVKPETPPEVAPVLPPPASPPQLRAPGLASGPETAGEIRAILDRAAGTLNRTDYRRLTRAQQTNYDTAKRFADEGEKELKAANYVLAKELAEKAERLAKELQVR